uniref:NADH dehydrogenase subunit 4L n=1 Tax=Lepidocyrtus fimetarius TaxID=2583952 RepID=A0A6G8FF01_9HEXA|nr:NADH dehydrogenase subunit 4L [Lepidocyrtus fimetarius]QIM14974.1 NADH dehydrogenase subunit 4L [Lepidocyrtus fimetarius]
MNLMHAFLVFNIVVGLYIYCMTFKHLLVVLLSLEFLAVMIFFLFILFLCEGSYYYSLVYLIMVACEGALGLSVLIVMGRSHGGDYFSSFSLLY